MVVTVLSLRGGQRPTRQSQEIASSSTRNDSVRKVLKILKKRFPNPGAMELGGDPFRTLCAVMLSARTRDEQVLKLLPGFFAAFPTPGALAAATVKDIEAKVNTIGMYRQKAKNLKKMAERLERPEKAERRRGEVPDTMEELVELPGVGRKTASVVLASCFGQDAIAVDTHVHRVTNRLGWVRTKTPEKTEAALLAIVPKDVMKIVNQVFVKFGRYVCIGAPRCWMCPVKDACAYAKKNLVPPANADAIRADIERRERELETSRRFVIARSEATRQSQGIASRQRRAGRFRSQ